VNAGLVINLLRHAQHARDINIHTLHPLPEKIGLDRCADFLHSGTGYIQNSRVRSIIDFCADFSHSFSERALLVLKNSITISITKIGVVEPVKLKSRVCSMQISVTISMTIFCTVEHLLYTLCNTLCGTVCH